MESIESHCKDETKRSDLIVHALPAWEARRKLREHDPQEDHSLRLFRVLV